MALLPAFATDASKQAQWQAFVRRRVTIAGAAPPLWEIMSFLGLFLLPLLEALRAGIAFAGAWPTGGPWTLPDSAEK